MVQTIICLSGKKGSGKSLAANMIAEMVVGKSIIYPMATMLKKVVADVTNTDIKLLEFGDFKKRLSPYRVNRFGKIEPLTYRQCLLHFGKVLRYDNDDVFINDVILKIERSTEPIFIIPDIREVREIKSIKDFTYTNDIKICHIQILRNIEYDDTSYDKTEIDLDGYKDFDYTINNITNDPNDLKQCIKLALNRMDIDTKPTIIETTMFK